MYGRHTTRLHYNTLNYRIFHTRTVHYITIASSCNVLAIMLHNLLYYYSNLLYSIMIVAYVVKCYYMYKPLVHV